MKTKTVDHNHKGVCNSPCANEFAPQHTPTPPYKLGLVTVESLTMFFASRFATLEDKQDIVRAVNCHEEMLRLLKEFIKDQDCYCQLDKSVGAVGVCPIHEAIEAIAKAEGK